MSSQPIVKLMKMMTNNLIAIFSHSFKAQRHCISLILKQRINLIVVCAYINLKLHLQFFGILIFVEKYEMLIV